MELQKIGLAYVNPSDILPNPENPRKKMGFDKKRLGELLESIRDLGILVPLIAYFDEKENKYVLLDGERRWRCAKELNLKKMPVNLIEKLSRLQNILEMFNIHNVRIEWGAMETAWKLEKIMKESGKTKNIELARLTSLKPSEVRKLKILLEYPKRYQMLVFDGPEDGGLKEDFLVELNLVIKFIQENIKNYESKFLDSIINKHKNKIILNYPKEFRLLKKILSSENVSKEKKIQILKSLGNDKNYSIIDANEESIHLSLSYESFIKKCSKIKVSLDDLIISDLKRSEKEFLKTQLVELSRILERKIKELK